MFQFHWVYKALDAALTAHTRPSQGARDLFQSILRRRTSHYNRIASVMNLFDRLVPGLSKNAARRLLNLDRLPLPGCQARLLSYGSGATVFLLENGQDRKVLKVYRRSLGRPARRAWEVAREAQEKYARLAAWFNSTYPIVSPSQYMVIHSPLLGVTSAGVLQPYISGRIYDLLRDFSIEEAVALGRTQAQLGRQLLDFSTRLLRAVDEQGWCFDMIGPENIMLVESGGEWVLRIVDNGLFDVRQVQATAPEVYRRLQTNLDHIKRIQAGLEESRASLAWKQGE